MLSSHSDFENVVTFVFVVSVLFPILVAKSIQFIQLFRICGLCVCECVVILRFFFNASHQHACMAKLKRSSNVYQTIIKLMHALNIMFYGNILEVIFSCCFHTNLLRRFVPYHTHSGFSLFPFHFRISHSTF